MAADPADPADAYETPPDGFAIEPMAFECPTCGHVVRAVPGVAARLLACPACRDFLVIPADDGSTGVPDLGEEMDRDRSEVERSKADELDGLRLRNVIALRRAAMRSRSYAIIGAGACAMGGAKLVMMTVGEVRAVGWHGWHAWYVAVAALAAWGVVHFVRRAAYWGRESRPPRTGICEKCGYDIRASTGNCPECGTPVPPNQPPPDFSSLSDGTQHARNLEDLR
jgi:hypothetical protein